jgi:DNA helicase HerA-like ATPase
MTLNNASSANSFGITTSGSSIKDIIFIALDKDQLLAIVGRMVYMDFHVAGDLYRSIGTVTEMKTENSAFNSQYESIIARGNETKLATKDLRRSSFTIQATFKKGSNGSWIKDSSALPTSPSTGVFIQLLDESVANEMVEGEIYPTIGYFRGMENVAQPLVIPNFAGSVGAKSSAILGRSGSGKSSMYTMILGGYMQHEEHAILVIDPQGQWSNENGMIFSPQNFARGLGREVSVLRVSEDIRLPMDEEIFSRMINKINVWKKGFRKMGPENLEAFSDSVVSRIDKAVKHNYKALDGDPRELLTGIFKDIANSSSTMSRIYASKETRDRFQRDLLILAGEPLIDPETDEQEILTADDLADVEDNWEHMLSYFIPLQNLFASKNLSGGKRRALGGENGFLNDVLKVRKKGDAPAPYVIFDMSPSVELHARSDLLGGADSSLYMQKILDNQDIKALILMMMLAEMKRASEVAFATGEGNLNTQIVFDEAWRFAPEGRATPEIEELASILEGFALDTRKFGIGWTYILQSPSDLKNGIWKQLSYVYAGYGLVGDDIRRLETLTDDPKQLNLYRQFIPPASNNTYPFMILGPISPIIFTTAPAFINIFSGTDEFLEHNERWISAIVKQRSLPSITRDFMTQGLKAKEKYQESILDEAPKSWKIGRNTSTPSSKPQTIIKPKPVVSPEVNKDDNLDDLPF